MRMLGGGKGIGKKGEWTGGGKGERRVEVGGMKSMRLEKSVVLLLLLLLFHSEEFNWL